MRAWRGYVRRLAQVFGAGVGNFWQALYQGDGCFHYLLNLFLGLLDLVGKLLVWARQVCHRFCLVGRGLEVGGGSGG